MKKFNYLLILSAAFMLCACGGGSSGGAKIATSSGNSDGQTAASGKKSSKFTADIPDLNYVPVSVTLSEGVERIRAHETAESKIFGIYNVLDMQMTDFSDGVCFVSQTHKNQRVSSLSRRWAIMDKEGNLLTDYIYVFSTFEDYPYFYNGVCILSVAGEAMYSQKYVLINKRGEILREFPDLYKVSGFVNGVATGFISVKDVYKAEDGMTKPASTTNVYINTDGDYVFQHLQGKRIPLYRDFQPAQRYCNGLARYYDYHARAWGYIDREGEIVIPAIYKDASDFSEGYAAVMNAEQLWGFIDTTGATKINFIYSKRPSNFSGGFTTVAKRDGGMGSVALIDRAGTLRMDSLMSMNDAKFYNGKAFIAKRNPARVSAVSNIMLVDTDLNVLQEWPDYDFEGYYRPNYTENGVLYYQNGEESFYITDEAGNLMSGWLKAPFRDGVARISIGDKSDIKTYTCGFINTKGEIVIAFRESEF